jgi:hypothetical protein
MTQAVFEEWLEDLKSMMKKNRKILLLVYNATSHSVTKVMSKVSVKFLPPNLTSEVQLLEQGIIHAVKWRYHHQKLQ